MTGSTKAEVETIKKFLSRTNDNIRLTYRRDPSPLLRRCMIVGTTNDPRCLPNDASGNRRFLPVPCAGGDPAKTRAYLGREPRAAVGRSDPPHRVTKGETAYLPDNLKGAQAELTEQYRAVDEVAEEVIGSWLVWRQVLLPLNVNYSCRFGRLLVRRRTVRWALLRVLKTQKTKRRERPLGDVHGVR